MIKRFFITLLTCNAFLILSAQEMELDKDWKFKPGDNLEWANPLFNDNDWSPLEVGKPWNKLGYDTLNGFAWYRLRIVITSDIKNKAFLKDSVKIILGKIDDEDQVFINGKQVGQNAGYLGKFATNEFFYQHLRKYNVPVNAILWDKENVIAIRVYDKDFNWDMGGGMYEGPYSITMFGVSDLVNINLINSSFRFLASDSLERPIDIQNKHRNELSGDVQIKVTDLKTNKIVLESSIKVILPPDKISTFSYKLPKGENLFAEYVFTEKQSNTKIKNHEEIPYILTPAKPDKPVINGAKVFGVKAGSPFLFSIAASGKRPLAYSAKNLPNGLVLDPQTGRITGMLSANAEYIVTIFVENKYGKAESKLKIVVGNTLALTPPMGWNAYYCWSGDVNDAKMRQAADFMQELHLADYGWTYINIDDYWEGLRDQNGEITSNAKFPDMKNLSDYIHSKGLKFGIYSSPGPKTCGGFEGSYKYEEQDIKTYEKWGIDFVKYDWCSYSSLVSSKPTLEEFKMPYMLMGEKISKAKRDMVYSLCQYGMGEVWKWGAEVKGNMWRTNGDIEDRWDNIQHIGFEQDVTSPYTAQGCWNDLDMLMIGRMGMLGWDIIPHQSRMSPNEQYFQVSLWALLSAPLFISNDLSKMDDFTLNLITNNEVIAINQDPLAKPTTRLAKTDSYQIWSKELEDGSIAIGIFSTAPALQKIKINWADIKNANNKIIRDLWRQKDIGKTSNINEFEVPKHGVILIKILKI